MIVSYILSLLCLRNSQLKSDLMDCHLYILLTYNVCHALLELINYFQLVFHSVQAKKYFYYEPDFGHYFTIKHTTKVSEEQQIYEHDNEKRIKE